jgi:arylesterase/paraoxonase
MKKMWGVYAAIAAVLYLIVNTLNVAGSFKSIEPHEEGATTTTYTGVPGPEDMDVDVASGQLFISSTDRWKVLRGLPSDDGIFVLDLDSIHQPRKLRTTYSGEFHPHGISLIQTSQGPQLFVVNHNPAGNFVEIFNFRNDTLFHQRSISDPSMCCPNDVVAVAPDKFYVTNDHGTPKGFKRTMEDYLQLPFGSLLYYDGAAFSTACSGLRYPNGVNVSDDGTRLYVSTTTGRNLLTFDRDEPTGKITMTNKLSLKTGLDNIDVDVDGNLWIAAHPKLFAFVGHAKDSSKLSPSQVLKLVPQKDGSYQAEELLMDDGSQLSGSSIAVRYKDELFVGGVFQRKILRIKLGTTSKP